jgi:putative transposase
MKKRFTNEQMIYTLRQVETGTSVAEVCRKTGITEQTFYRWKKKFGGMGVAELARLKQLEDENRKLKSLVADLTLDKHMLQEVLRKKYSGFPILVKMDGAVVEPEITPSQK